MSLPDKNVMIQTQDIQYRKPVYLNDEILLKSSIDEVSEAVQCICFKLKFYRVKVGAGQELVASGHVSIGMLK